MLIMTCSLSLVFSFFIYLRFKVKTSGFVISFCNFCFLSSKVSIFFINYCTRFSSMFSLSLESCYPTRACRILKSCPKVRRPEIFGFIFAPHNPVMPLPLRVKFIFVDFNYLRCFSIDIC